MRYAVIKEMDTTNGKGIGVSLFVQGCPHHCKGCFNPETWNYDGGKEWTKEVEDKFLELISRPYITRLSLLGGEPMVYPLELADLIDKVRKVKPTINIWLWSGYTYSEILDDENMSQLAFKLDYLIDGRFEEKNKNLMLLFRGSSNQTIIRINDEKND